MANLIDGHVHLHEFDPVGPVLERAAAAGVGRVLAVGMDLETDRKTLELAGRWPDRVYPAVGYHPWSIVESDVEAALAFVEEHLEDCVAAGEIGLDYKVKTKKPLQREVFAKILTMARDKGKPAIVHTRFSHERAYRMVLDSGVKKAVFHWYSGPLDTLDRIVESGFFISATPAAAFSKAHRAALSRAPLEKILVETDAPVKYRYKSSEPAALVDTIRHLALLKGASETDVARATAENAERFYQLFEPLENVARTIDRRALGVNFEGRG